MDLNGHLRIQHRDGELTITADSSGMAITAADPPELLGIAIASADFNISRDMLPMLGSGRVGRLPQTVTLHPKDGSKPIELHKAWTTWTPLVVIQPPWKPGDTVWVAGVIADPYDEDEGKGAFCLNIDTYVRLGFPVIPRDRTAE